MNRMSKPRRTIHSSSPIDEIVGCNVRGRLEFILELSKGHKHLTNEVKALLEFFPEED